MKIAQLLPVTLIEYPGKVSALIYTEGCNFRCPFCHNAELVLPCKYKSLIPEKEVLQLLQERSGFLDALAITGGEPTLQPDLIEFLYKVKDLGLLVKLDSNGSRPEVLKLALQLKLVDYVAMDVKTTFDKYDSLIGAQCNCNDIKDSIDIIRGFAPDYEFRTTVAPTITQDDLYDVAEYIKGSKRYYLQKFITYKDKDLIDPAWNDKRGLPRKKLDEVWENVSKLFDIGGVR